MNMADDPEAIYVTNQGLAGAIFRLIIATIFIALIASALFDLSEARYLHGVGQVVAAGLIVQAIR